MTPIPRRRFGFVVAATSVTAMMAGASAPSPFYPGLQERLGLPAVGITVAFAIYAVVLLGALLVAGSLSDHLGRRPVLSTGLVLLAVSAVLLEASPTTEMLFTARALQGLASGLLLSALSATVTDFGPPDRPRTAALVNSAAPMVGLALGAVVAGAVLDLSPDAAALVFLPLAAVYAVLSGAIWLAPETSPREPGWRRSLAPRVSVPPPARRAFLLSIPVIAAGWATGGLFLSLGASIVHTELHADGHTGQGLVIGLLPAAGAVAVTLLRNRSPRTTTVYGSSALAIGSALSLVALAFGSFPGYVLAILVVGTGFGTAFMGTIGTLAPTVPVHQRAQLFAAIYTVSYLAFSIPAVVAGVLVGMVGLDATVFGYGILVTLFAALAVALRVRADSSPAPREA